MSGDNAALFQRLDSYLAAVVDNLSPNARRRLARQLAYELRTRQQARISQQQNTDGSPYAPRRQLLLRTHRSVRFLWRDSVRELINWRTTGRGADRKITGYDAERGGVRSFLKHDIQHYIDINLSETTAKGKKPVKMFRRLRSASFLKATASAEGALVGFSGRTAKIAGVHQRGELDSIAPGVKARYHARELLGFSDSDSDYVADTVARFLAANL